MAKPKKIEVVKVGEEDGVSIYTDRKTALRGLLVKKTPAIFDREPAAAFNANLDRLVEEINSIYS
jgi:hypothetical protein